MDVERRIEKCCCICKNDRGKVMKDGKKYLCTVIRLTKRSRVRRKNKFWGIPARATSYCLLPNTFFKNAFKVGTVKFADSLSPPSIVKKYAPEVKASKGLKRCREKSREVTTPPAPSGSLEPDSRCRTVIHCLGLAGLNDVRGHVRTTLHRWVELFHEDVHGHDGFKGSTTRSTTNV